MVAGDHSEPGAVEHLVQRRLRGMLRGLDPSAAHRARGVDDDDLAARRRRRPDRPRPAPVHVTVTIACTSVPPSGGTRSGRPGRELAPSLGPLGRLVSRSRRARATVMLSCPPWSFAQATAPRRARAGRRTSRPRSADQVGAARRRPRSSSSTGRRSRPGASRGRSTRSASCRGVWSGASTPSQRVIACACGAASASARGTPAAICSAAHESSTVSKTAARRRRAASRRGCRRPCRRRPDASSRTAATNVQDGGSRRSRGGAFGRPPVGGVGGRLERAPIAARPDRLGCARPARARRPARRGPRARRPGCDVRVCRTRDAVAHDQHRARRPARSAGERRRVLVAVVPDAAVADRRHPRAAAARP